MRWRPRRRIDNSAVEEGQQARFRAAAYRAARDVGLSHLDAEDAAQQAVVKQLTSKAGARWFERPEQWGYTTGRSVAEDHQRTETRRTKHLHNQGLSEVSHDSGAVASTALLIDDRSSQKRQEITMNAWVETVMEYAEENLSPARWRSYSNSIRIAQKQGENFTLHELPRLVAEDTGVSASTVRRQLADAYLVIAAQFKEGDR